jgi:coproporphyrinogen III oxidase
MDLQALSQRLALSSGAVAFNTFLRQTQSDWAKSLQSLETQATWQIEHRTLDHHDSLIYQIADGDFLEKGGINYSFVRGDALPSQATQTTMAHLTGQPFVAMGLSTILHPRNPFVPTVHCNLRYFQTCSEDPTWWFAGVMDLTPTYGFADDSIHWHRTCRSACRQAGIEDAQYHLYKQACDQYYYLPHRKEHRGIGGLWIEQYNDAPFANCQQLIESIGQHFMPAYLPIAQKRQAIPFTNHHRQFQSFRRNRYVEFNLLYDRGTKFGLAMGSRTESILISMPPQASWPYNWQPKSDSVESRLHGEYLQPRDWLSMND